MKFAGMSAVRAWACVLALATAAASAQSLDGAISGMVTLPGGAALSVEHIRLQRLSWNGLYWEHTGMTPQLVGSNGYAFTQLAPATYRVCYEDNVLLRHCFDGHDETSSAAMGFTSIALSAGEQHQNVNLLPQPGHEIRGRVHNRYEPALPMESVALTLYDESGAACEDIYYLPLDSNGNYVLGGVAPGRYYLKAGADTFTPQFHPGDECVDDCWPSLHGEPIIVSNDRPLHDIDFDMAPYSVIRMRVVDSTTGIDIANPRVGVWSPMMGPVLVRPARYHAESGEYILYMSQLGENVAASATGYVARFVIRGHCHLMDGCFFQYPLLVMDRNEVRHVTLRLVTEPSYLFANDFE